MKKLRQRILCFMLVLTMFGTGLPLMEIRESRAAVALTDYGGQGPVSLSHNINFNTSAIRRSGTIGNIKWGIDANGVFAFYHSNATPDKAITNATGFPTFSQASEVLWRDYVSEIKYVTMANLDSYIVLWNMNYYFSDCKNLKYVIMLPAAANSMECTFANCTSLVGLSCAMPEVYDMEKCFYGCKSLNRDVVFVNNPRTTKNAFTNTACKVIVRPEYYNEQGEMATQSGCSDYCKMGSCQLTLYGLSRTEGELTEECRSDAYVSPIRYGQKLSDAEVGSTGGLRLAYKRYGQSYQESVYIPALIDAVKRENREWSSVLKSGEYTDCLDILMVPRVNSLGRIQASVFYGSAFKKLTVERCPLSECNIVFADRSYVYNGSAIIPSVSLYNPYNSEKLTVGTDYTVVCSNNINAGTATVTFTGKGQYSGTVARTYEISKASMAGNVTATGYSGVYDGKAHGISVTAPSGAVVWYGLSQGTCNQTTPLTFDSAGSHTVYFKVTKDNYIAYVSSKTVEITPADMTVSAAGYSGVYDKRAHGISVSVSNPPGGTEIRYGTSSGTYNLSQSPTYVNAGSYTVYYQVTAPNHKTYTGSAVVTNTRKDIAACSISDVSGGKYNAQPHTPSVSVSDGTAALVKDTDYTVAYSNNVNAGTASVTITGKGNYTGTVVKTFSIAKADMSVSVSNYSGTYDRTAHGITVRVDKPSSGAVVMYGMSNGTYDLSSSPRFTEAGSYTVYYQITAPNYATYTGAGTVKISGKNISACNVSGIRDGVYNGNAHTPEVSVYDGNVLLVKGTDYTVTYSNNINAGTASVTITGKGNYTGSAVKTFSIAKADMTVSAAGYSGTYDKSRHGVSVQVSRPASGAVIRYGTSAGAYSLMVSPTYENAGKYTVYYQVSAPNYNTYTGSAAVNICAKNIGGCVMETIADETYDGRAHTPLPVIADGEKILEKDVDYTVTYNNNTNAGTAEAAVTGKGNYVGNVTKSFRIHPLMVEDLQLWQDEFEYNGNPHRPEAQGYKASDYVVEYHENTDAGTASAVFCFQGNYTGTVTKEFVIHPKKVTEEIIFPEASEITYSPGIAVSQSALSAVENEYGSFRWENPDQTAVVKNDGYTVRFTPKDSRNYDWKEVEGWNETEKAVIRKIPLTVKKASGELPAMTASCLAEGEVLGDSQLSWDGETGDLSWSDPDIRVSTGVSAYLLDFIPEDDDNYDWTSVGEWDEINQVYKVPFDLTVIANPEAPCLKEGDRLASSVLTSKQEGAVYEWETPDLVVVKSETSVNAYPAIYRYRGETLVRMVPVLIWKEPVQTVEPVETAKPAGTEKPVETIKPAEAERPVQTIKPVETAKPAETEKPVETIKPIETAKPAETEKPVQTIKPIETAKPAGTEEPVQTIKPIETAKPAETEKPVETAKPVKTEEPVQTIKPIETAKPAETEKPVETAKPAKTEKPVQTVKPAETEEPVQTVEPTVTEEPVQTIKPAGTHTPLYPDATQAPDLVDPVYEGVEQNVPNAYEIVNQYIKAKMLSGDVAKDAANARSINSIRAVGASIKTKWLKKRNTTIRLKKGAKLRLRIKGVSKKRKFKWRSLRKSIVSVNKNGIITAKKKGTAKITVRVGKKRYVCRIKVRK